MLIGATDVRAMSFAAHRGRLRTIVMTVSVHGLFAHVGTVVGTAHWRTMTLQRAWRGKARTFVAAILKAAR